MADTSQPLAAGDGATDAWAGIPLGAAPLLVGAVGDELREGDVAVLADRLRERLIALASRYPATSPMLLASLRTTGERLAARVALDCGWPLIVPVAAAETDPPIDDETARERDDLLSRAARIVALDGADVQAERGPASRLGQAACASLPGAFIARHCQVLLAVWDGQASQAPGDAAETVRFRLEGLPEELEATASRLDDEAVGPVDQVVAPRAGGGLPANAFSWRQLTPTVWGRNPALSGDDEKSLKRQDEFNGDIARWSKALAAERACSRGYVLPAEIIAGTAPAFGDMLERFVLADVLAMHFQKRTLGILRAVVLLALVAALSLQMADNLPWRPGTSTAVYLTALLTALGLYLWSQRGRFESRHLDYRALAEGLRVQMFWWLAGRSESVADLYLRRQRGELDWIRAALQTGDLLDRETGAAPNPLPGATAAERLRLVAKHWVEDQRDYYLKRATIQGQISQRYAVSKKVCFYISLSQAFLKLWPSAHPLLSAFGMTLLVAGLLHLYAKTRAFAEHARQYERLGKLFDQAARVLAQAADAENWNAASAVVAEAGREALQENADWLLLHRERPVSVPGI